MMPESPRGAARPSFDSDAFGAVEPQQTSSLHSCSLPSVLPNCINGPAGIHVGPAGIHVGGEAASQGEEGTSASEAASGGELKISFRCAHHIYGR